MSHTIGESLFLVSSCQNQELGQSQKKGEEMPAQLRPGLCPRHTGVGRGRSGGESSGDVSLRNLASLNPSAKAYNSHALRLEA